MFDVSIMMVSLIERDTLTFKARAGIKACGADRNGSSCAHAIAQQNIFVVPDATLDARFENHPLVLGAPFIRLYAGGPLRFHRAADRLALHHGQPAS
jgi:GAF domain-containing protein